MRELSHIDKGTNGSNLSRCHILELEKLLNICNLWSLRSLWCKSQDTKLRGCDLNYLTNPNSISTSYMSILSKINSQVHFLWTWRLEEKTTLVKNQENGQNAHCTKISNTSAHMEKVPSKINGVMHIENPRGTFQKIYFGQKYLR